MKKVGILLALVMVLSFSLVTAVPVAAATDYYVRTDGSDTNNGSANDASNAWLTIQHAINTVVTGDTINVAAGTYTEDLAIDKGLTLEGAQAGIAPTVEGVRTNPAEESTVTGSQTITASDVTVDGFTLDGDITINDAAGPISGGTISNNLITGAQYGIRVGYGVGQGVDGVNIEGNVIDGNTSKGILFYNAGDYEAQHISNITISGNDITNNGSSGISTYGPGPNIITGNFVSGNAGNGISIKYDDGDVISGNTVTNNTAMGINMHQVTNAVVEDNTVSGHVNPGVVTTFWGELTDVGKGSGIYVHEASVGNTIRNNDITGNNNGILISSESGELPLDNSIIYNNLTANNYYGVLNALVSPPAPVDATLNWWGDATGADHADNPHGENAAGDAVSDNVNFIPWYATATTTPDTEYVSVDHTFSSIIAYSDTIQGGIDAALSGDTINVEAGIYDEQVEIDKPLTLQGPNASISPVTDTRVAEAIITGVSPLVKLPSDANVNPLTIEGFTFQNATDSGVTRQGVILADGVSVGWGNVIIRSNRFMNNYGPAVGVWSTSGLANWIITDNLIDGVTGPSKSGIYLDLDYMDLGAGSSFTGWEVSNNTVRNTQYGGIMVHHGVDIVISGNTIEDVQKTGIQSSGIQGNVIITDNVISSAMLDRPGFRAGIRLYGTDPLDEYGESQLIGPVSVTNNIVTDSYIGFATKSGHDYTAQEVHVNGNSFIGNTGAGLRHNGTGLLDATNNWWGDVAGPSIVTNPYDDPTEGDTVSTNVDYIPWLIRTELTSGWNVYSTPIAPDASISTIGDALDLWTVEGSGDLSLGYYYGYDSEAGTQAWISATADTALTPLQAVYLNMTAAATIDVVFSTSYSEIPSKIMYADWNLVGLAELYAMNPEDALASAYYVAGTNNIGYSQVVSPPVGQTAWSGVRRSAIDSDVGGDNKMLPTNGYWLLMVNEGTLGGFTSTPIAEVLP